MDAWALGLMAVGYGVYLLGDKKKVGWLWVGGVGTGLLVGALWAMVIITNAFAGIGY